MRGTGDGGRPSQPPGVRGTRQALRSVREDLLSFDAAPLPPSEWLRWLPHGVVWLIAVIVTGTEMAMLADGYRQNAQYAVAVSLVQGAAVVLALRRPVPAWLLSTTVAVVVALAARSQLISGQATDGMSWPWSVPGLFAQALVVLLLALRVPTRVTVEALAVTALATYLVQGVVGAANYESTGVTAVALFTGMGTLGSALRGRRVARSQLVEQTEITAEERARRTLLEERSRIARELHDVVAHHMSVISIQAQVAPHLVQDPSEELKENLAGIRQNALEALTELRRVLGVLRSEHPEEADGLGEMSGGLAPDAPQPTLDRLDALIANTRAAGLAVTTEIMGEAGRPYPPGVELSAYRIVQEALSNVLRHAPGSTAAVGVTHFPEGLYIGVVNSPPKQPVPPFPGAGHGLLGMRERTAMLGGRLSATRTREGGFAVTAFLPRDAEGAASWSGDGLDPLVPSPRLPARPAEPPTGDKNP
ncbi:sensor histidine kinase [Streptomyces sp. NPDC093094]|uniref:sensor histidine kinase n=1 Tax=Streptomyces sp. NPDC093094 TaxID=3366026 RepID=UPI0037FB9645